MSLFSKPPSLMTKILSLTRLYLVSVELHFNLGLTLDFHVPFNISQLYQNLVKVTLTKFPILHI